MRMSEHFGETLRKPPAEAETPGYALLLRAGYIRSPAAGLFAYLPLGLRTRRKIETILREEIDGIGGQEIGMPIVQPAALWGDSASPDRADVEVVSFRDRADRSWV
ncbi:MAG: hypothetical protein PVJ43_15565, partial [Gemmatimonadales bacterium]